MPFKVCRQCGKQVRIADASCWNCHAAVPNLPLGKAESSEQTAYFFAMQAEKAAAAEAAKAKAQASAGGASTPVRSVEPSKVVSSTTEKAQETQPTPTLPAVPSTRKPPPQKSIRPPSFPDAFYYLGNLLPSLSITNNNGSLTELSLEELCDRLSAFAAHNPLGWSIWAGRDSVVFSHCGREIDGDRQKMTIHISKIHITHLTAYSYTPFVSDGYTIRAERYHPAGVGWDHNYIPPHTDYFDGGSGDIPRWS
jgi:hypothetical protein